MKFALRASEMVLRTEKYAARMKCAEAHKGEFYFISCLTVHFIYTLR